MADRDCATHKICGFAGEATFARLMADNRKIKPMRFDTKELLKLARSTRIGQRRLTDAEPYLLQEFGVSTRDRAQRYHLSLDWESLPAALILDRVYGIDFAFCFFGYIFGIDCTTNSELVPNKQRKLKHLTPLLQKAGFDRVAVAAVGEKSTSTALTDQLMALKRSLEIGMVCI